MARAREELPEGAEAVPRVPGLTIRPAVLEDAEAVAEIEVQSFSNPWHRMTFRSLIAHGRGRILVAEDPPVGVVGYTVFWWVMEQGELANLAVAPAYRGRGVGSALLDRALEEAGDVGIKSFFLEVRSSNDPALRLYRSRGFAEIGVRKDYYRKPHEDARVLMKALEE